ncbi:MAG TPA: ATP-binding protein [Candidatus Nanoarchaeia archaeon]|nr:ATP-binding protein [Candidatus Nanoarchaeia archaeon]
MDGAEILRILNKYNPWWDNKEISPSKMSDFKRGDFHVLKNSLERKEIISIIGPRRVGKTILIHQLIQYLLNSGVVPKRIFYLSVDEVELNDGGAQIKDIFETYSKYVIKTPLDEIKEKHYFFLDEIQEIPKWETILKNWYDFGYNIKFIISGSSSIWISKGTEESLLGRIKSTVMLPLKFSEVLRYQKILPDDFYLTKRKLRESLLEAIQKSSVMTFKEGLDVFLGEISSKRESIEILLNRYLTVGGYPEFLDEKDYTRIGEAVRDKVKLIFFKDIVRYFRIRNPSVLEDLFKLLARQSSSSFNLVQTASLLDIQRPTLKSYLKYLTKAYLIKSSQYYSLSRKHRIRKQEKIYVLDPGIRNGIIGFIDDTLINNDTELGFVVESVLFDHLIRLKFNLEPGPEPEIFYWKNKKEIDFVLPVKKKAIPIESKFRNRIRQDTLQSIEDFIKEKDSPFGIVVTKEEFRVENKVLLIPLWLFLLMI